MSEVTIPSPSAVSDGYLRTTLAVAVGSASAFIAVGVVEGFFVLFILPALPESPLTGEKAITALFGGLGAIAAAAATFLFVVLLVEKATNGGRPRYRSARRTAWLAGAFNGSGVLVVTVLTASYVPSAAAEVIGRVWTWPLWFLVVGCLARWIALATGRVRTS
jgi:hypothetical protein